MTVPDSEWLARQFETHRSHLRSVAYRMLGSLSDADDAVQDSWMRLSRSDAQAIENLGGWLTTVVARVSLDMLRARESRREASLDGGGPRREPMAAADPEQEAQLADSVGLALLVVLDTLDPAERLAFVLHDMFAVPFEEIAPIVGRSSEAARQLASRARRRVRGASAPAPDLDRQREIVDAYLAAARAGDFEALLRVLDPDVVVRLDDVTARFARGAREIRGASTVARRALQGRARAGRTAIVNGAAGIIVAPRGRLLMVLRFTIVDGRIIEIDAVGDAARVRELQLTLPEG